MRNPPGVSHAAYAIFKLMKRFKSVPWLLFRPKRFTTIVMMLIIWAGVAGALFAGISTDFRNREYLKGRAQTIANALPAADIKNLRGNQDDLASVSYIQLKDRLQQVRAANPDLSFVNLLGQKNGRLYYRIDTENSGPRSPTGPGATFNGTSARLQSAFSSSEPAIDGPHRDKRGVWVSAYSPVLDPATGNVMAVVAVDSAAWTYYGQILLYALVPLLLAAIPLAGLIRDMKLQSKEHEILQLKNQFVSIASHELRSPLAGMLWAIQSLSKTSASRLTIEQLSMLSDMYRSTESSLATVNEILDMSIFDRGQSHKLQHERMDLAQVIKQVAATLKLGAQEKDLEFVREGDWPPHVYVDGDVAALKRALMNIISNAIKYSREHTNIALIYRKAEREHQIGIKDHGIGIPADEQAKVLGGYYRASNATAVQAHGTGLGLLVTQKIIEQHGGRLWFNSKLNEGTTIYIALPIASDPAAAKNQAPRQLADQASQDQDSSSTGKPSLRTAAPH